MTTEQDSGEFWFGETTNLEVHPTADAAAHVYDSPFDRAFFLQAFDRRAVELPVALDTTAGKV